MTDPVLRLLVNELAIELTRVFSSQEISKALIEIGALQMTFDGISAEEIAAVAQGAIDEAPQLKQKAVDALKAQGTTFEEAVAKERERRLGDIMAQLPTKGVH